MVLIAPVHDLCFGTTSVDVCFLPYHTSLFSTIPYDACT